MPETPEAIRAIRNLLFWRRILGSSSRTGSRDLQAIPEGIAQATAERDQPVSLFGLLRRAISKDSLRGLAAAIDFFASLWASSPLVRESTSQTRQLMKLGKI